MKCSSRKNMMLFVFLSAVLTGCLEPESTSVVESGNGTSGAPPDFVVVPSTPATVVTPANPDTPSAPVCTLAVNGGCEAESGSDITYDFVINNGAPHTSLLELQLSVFGPAFVKSIKIGEKTDCSDGIKESFKENLVMPVFRRNAVNQVAVQFFDYGDSPLACITKKIVQDDRGPDIIISQYPLTTLEEGSKATICYTAYDISPIKNVICRLNEITKPCTSGLSQVSLNEMPEGTYVFKVEATDEHGFTSSQSVSWNVAHSTKKVTQVVEIKDNRKVDILIVVDNSGSMKYEQKSMANRVSNMLTVFEGLDWQIGVTTTDPRNIALGDGRLIPIFGMSGQLILNPSVADAQTKLGMTLQRPEVGSGAEQPIYTTYRFIERTLSGDPAYNSFFREGANFATIVISDEDESANTFRNDPEKLIKFVSDTYQQQKVFTWHSIITKPGDTACKNTHGAVYGERLFKMAQLTGGLVGSVCESDYAQQVTGIANGIRNMNKSLGLTCQSLNQYPIVILRNGVEFTKPFVKEGMNLKFAEILEPGSYSIEYRCLK